MFSLNRHLLALAAFAIVALMSLSANAEPKFEVSGDRLTRIGADEAAIWTIRHPSVYETKGGTTQRFQILGPVPVEGRWYYAAGTSLFELDPERGVIRDRLQFPAPIVELKPAGALVETVVEAPTEPGTTRVTLRYRPGTPGPREVWRLTGWHQPFKDVTYLAEPLGQHDGEFSPEARRAALDVLRAHQHQEPNNPFYAFFAAEQLAALGEAEQAARNFDAARDNPGAGWASDVQLAMMFDERGDYDRGDVAFDRAMGKLAARHPNFTKSGTLVTHAVLMGIWSRDAIAEAVQARDFAAVDRMQTRVTRLFPHLEQSRTAWSALASWYAEHQRDDLARKWRANAAQASMSPWDSLDDGARDVDLALALFVGFGFAAWLAAFAAGLRSTPRDGRLGWLPRPRLVEVVGLLATVAVSTALVWLMSVRVAEIGLHAAVPIELIHEYYGSPAVGTWLTELEPSPARDELLAHAKAMRTAHQTGAPEPAPIAGGAELAARAISADAAQTTWAAIFTAAPANRWIELPPIQYLVPPWAVMLAIMLVAGAALRRRNPLLADRLLVVIPGAARAAAPITGIVAGLFIAAVASLLLGIDTILQDLARPAFAKYYGLEAIYDERAGASHAWAWATLVVALVVHAFTSWLDRRAEPAPDR